MHTILVADDESNITDVCARYLNREGYRTLTAGNGEEALRLWKEASPDLIVLDLMMPVLDGWQVCERIRNVQDTPIIMLTARGEEMDRIMGLTMGADDYLTKPFSPRELVLRVKGILRRTRHAPPDVGGAAAEPASGTAIRYPGLSIDAAKRSVKVRDQDVELTVKEFELLWLLASHPGQVFSRNQLLNRIWEMDFYGDATTVTVHVRRLREKIESNPSEPAWIKTVWGIGYKFDDGDFA